MAVTRQWDLGFGGFIFCGVSKLYDLSCIRVYALDGFDPEIEDILVSFNTCFLVFGIPFSAAEILKDVYT